MPSEGPPQKAASFCGDRQQQLDELHIAITAQEEE